MLTPPLIVLKWISTVIAFVACTPPLIVAVCTAFSSLPSTSVAPCSTNRPPRIVDRALAHADAVLWDDDALVRARVERAVARGRAAACSERRRNRKGCGDEHA